MSLKVVFKNQAFLVNSPGRSAISIVATATGLATTLLAVSQPHKP